MHFWKLILLVPVGVFLAGCASQLSVTENQCRAGDWQTIGQRDGASGYLSARILTHQEACGEFGIVPQRSSYLIGWEDGVRTFYMAERSLQQGQRGVAFTTVGQDELREPYDTAYNEGRQLYTAHREVNRLIRQIDNRTARLNHIKRDIVAATTERLSPVLKVQDRVSLVVELEALVEERAKIKAKLPELEQALV